MKSKRLELEIIIIRDIAFCDETKISDGTLFINKNELIDVVRDPALDNIRIELAKPGESVRIVPVKDVIEPRIKSDGSSFPGFLGNSDGTGEGSTKVLRGCGVVTAGKIVGFQEGIIDMTGPATDYCIYSKLNNIVVIADPIDGITPAEHETALRIAGLKAAQYLARAGLDVEPDETETYYLDPVDPARNLPKVGVVYMTLAQGLLHDNYVYGKDAKTVLPMFIHPNELFDGAMVNGNCVCACDKRTTFEHQNHDVVKELYRRHGVDVDFVGIIMVPTNPVLAQKQRNCKLAIEIVKELGLDGVIIPEEGGGNPEADLMLLCRGCEECGARTVIIADAEGDEDCLTDTTPEADAIVSVAYGYTVLKIPPMDKVLGYPEQVNLLAGGEEGGLQNDGSMLVNLCAILGSSSSVGSIKATSKVF